MQSGNISFLRGELPATIGTNYYRHFKRVARQKSGSEFRLIKMIDNMIYQYAKVEM